MMFEEYEYNEKDYTIEDALGDFYPNHSKEEIEEELMSRIDKIVI